jgi:hypothetical protein
MGWGYPWVLLYISGVNIGEKLAVRGREGEAAQNLIFGSGPCPFLEMGNATEFIGACRRDLWGVVGVGCGRA